LKTLTIISNRAPPRGLSFSLQAQNTPLYVAAQNGHVGVVEVLVRHGAEINATASSDFAGVRTCLNPKP